MVSGEPWIHATAGDVRRNHDAYGNEIGKWIADYGEADWQWFVTCSLRDPPRTRGTGLDMAGPGQARRCLRSLLEHSKAREFVCVFEVQRRGAYHLHALLGGCPAINGRVAAAFFDNHFGISRWKIFKPGGAAPKYLGKYLTKDVVELYMGKDGPYVEEDFKVYTGGYTKKLRPRFTWDTTMKGTRV